MASQEDLLAARIADLLRELAVARNDGETMYMLGVLAGRMLMDAGMVRWDRMKSGLGSDAYDQLLLTAQNQGNELAGEENYRAAYALDLIMTSIVGSRFSNPRITQGVALIDEIIETAVSNWRRSNARAAS